MSVKAADHFDVNPNEHFSMWYTRIMAMADLIDNRYPMHGMFVWRPNLTFMNEWLNRYLVNVWRDKHNVQQTKFPSLIPYDLFYSHKEMCLEMENTSYWVLQDLMDVKEVQEGNKKKLCVLRSTSEMSIYSMMALWLQTWRDLPYMIFQTAQVFRHESQRSKTPLIRSKEMEWIEVHTAHETEELALDHLNKCAWPEYLKLLNEEMGVYGIKLTRPFWDTLPGAKFTQCYDIILPNGRVLQIVASHYTADNYSQVYGIRFQDRSETSGMKHAYLSCHAISSRALAAVIAAHGDRRGLRVPPQMARIQVVIVPIASQNQTTEIVNACYELEKVLKESGVRVMVDDSDERPGAKYFHHELRGVPLRIEVGPRDLANNTLAVARRDILKREIIPRDSLVQYVQDAFVKIQENLVSMSKDRLAGLVTDFTTLDAAVDHVNTKRNFVRVPMAYPVDDVQRTKEDKEEGMNADKLIYERTDGGELRGFVHPDELSDEDKDLLKQSSCVFSGRPATVFMYIAKP